jgi:Rho-binding antiterminator
MKPYLPISCDFYDILEALAVRQVKTTVEFMDGEKSVTLKEVIITDLQTRDKEEFMYLDNDQVIRLDQLVTVNGEERPGACQID